MTALAHWSCFASSLLTPNLTSPAGLSTSDDMKIKIEGSQHRNRYPFIVRWGQLLGSYPYYVDQQCDEAAADNAPENAVYKRDDGAWQTTDAIVNPTTRHELGLD